MERGAGAEEALGALRRGLSVWQMEGIGAGPAAHVSLAPQCRPRATRFPRFHKYLPRSPPPPTKNTLMKKADLRMESADARQHHHCP